MNQAHQILSSLLKLNENKEWSDEDRRHKKLDTSEDEFLEVWHRFKEV